MLAYYDLIRIAKDCGFESFVDLYNGNVGLYVSADYFCTVYFSVSRMNIVVAVFEKNMSICYDVAVFREYNS